MSEKASKNNIEDEELQDLIDQRIEQKKEEIKKEARKEARKELQSVKSYSNKVSSSSKASNAISRRQFLKKAGLGAAGLAVLMSPASALNLRSDSFSLQTSDDSGETLSEGLFVGEDQSVHLPNGDLYLNNNNLEGVDRINDQKADTLGMEAEVPEDKLASRSENTWYYNDSDGPILLYIAGHSNDSNTWRARIHINDTESENVVHKFGMDADGSGSEVNGGSTSVIPSGKYYQVEVPISNYSLTNWHEQKLS